MTTQDFKHNQRLKEAILMASNYCGNAEKCLFDVRVKLAQWNIDEALFNEILEYLVNEKFVDEERYTRFFVHDKFKFNHWGRIKIKHHLRQRQIPEAMIQNGLEESIDPEEYNKLIVSLYKKKLKTVKGSSSFEKNQKTVQYLSSRGFEPHLILDLIGDSDVFI